MAILNALGLGGTATALNNALSGNYQQQMQAAMMNAYATSSGTGIYRIDYDTSPALTATVFPPAKPKTNVDWLRERVDEMRVSMADFGYVH